MFALLCSDPNMSRCIATYLLACVVVAGLYGGATASRVILLVQAVPGAMALGALWALEEAGPIRPNGRIRAGGG